MSAPARPPGGRATSRGEDVAQRQEGAPVSAEIGSDSVHRVWKLGRDVDTDLLAPGYVMQHGIEVIAAHCLESVRPEFAGSVRAGDVVVAGPGFGIGSSREQAAAALVRLGVAAVIAPSYGGLFFRNAFNVGLMLLTCPQAESLAEAERIRIRLGETPQVLAQDGRVLACEAIPDFLVDMARSGGLLNQLRKRLSRERPASSSHGHRAP